MNQQICKRNFSLQVNTEGHKPLPDGGLPVRGDQPAHIYKILK